MFYSFTDVVKHCNVKTILGFNFSIQTIKAFLVSSSYSKSKVWAAPGVSPASARPHHLMTSWQHPPPALPPLSCPPLSELRIFFAPLEGKARHIGLLLAGGFILFRRGTSTVVTLSQFSDKQTTDSSVLAGLPSTFTCCQHDQAGSGMKQFLYGASKLPSSQEASLILTT